MLIVAYSVFLCVLLTLLLFVAKFSRHPISLIGSLIVVEIVLVSAFSPADLGEFAEAAFTRLFAWNMGTVGVLFALRGFILNDSIRGLAWRFFLLIAPIGIVLFMAIRDQ
ncbi:hypothetical protein C5Y96_21700 [Blastopirellula marina]|uniref:Uncharacterized protein n=1 Tax=Blastopirellula marina TaxID=124 RepID=A0A2S8F1U0_9BACT|nr:MULTISPECIES: hypothetical protein [Pirellulaceae]PQO26067.1 hypothetical protein C5Y96_21700 [Blastopirellula marina]RCS44425.1 hypothetical protein DTL36_21745 [Bremerella cremea]